MTVVLSASHGYSLLSQRRSPGYKGSIIFRRACQLLLLFPHQKLQSETKVLLNSILPNSEPCQNHVACLFIANLSHFKALQGRRCYEKPSRSCNKPNLGSIERNLSSNKPNQLTVIVSTVLVLLLTVWVETISDSFASSKIRCCSTFG